AAPRPPGPGPGAGFAPPPPRPGPRAPPSATTTAAPRISTGPSWSPGQPARSRGRRRIKRDSPRTRRRVPHVLLAALPNALGALPISQHLWHRSAVPCAPQAARAGSAIAIRPLQQRAITVAQLGWQKPADGVDMLAMARIPWQGTLVLCQRI